MKNIVGFMSKSGIGFGGQMSQVDGRLKKLPKMALKNDMTSSI